METNAVRAKATAEFTLDNIRNNVAMRDHDSLEEMSASVKSMRWILPAFRLSGCPTRRYEIG